MNDIREIIEKQRELCRFYLKIDFGMLAVFASIFTILKLERIEILQTLSNGTFIGIVLIICYGLLLDKWALDQWSKKELPSENLKVLKFGITLQFFLHFLLIGMLSGYVYGFSKYYPKGYATGKELTSITIGIEKFQRENKDFPETIDELIIKYPYISRHINKLGKDKLRYKKDESVGYIFRHAGLDEEFDTKDDIVENHYSFIEQSEIKF